MKRVLLTTMLIATSMGVMAGESYQEMDAKLNRTYQQITARLADDPDTTGLLVGAQRK